jgi:putative DNA primase/helicase
MIAELYGEVLRYDHKQGRWLIWSKRRCRWAEDKSRKIQRCAIAAARHRRKVAAHLADTEKSKREIAWSFQSENLHKVDAALEIARSLPPISDDGAWDADPWLLGVANGVVNLKTGKLRAERQDDRITKHSPVHFVPEASCPRFQLFLDEVFNGDPALIDYKQRCFGYCLTGSVGEQCVFCWHGSGANGKSTLGEVLRYILGDYAVNLPFSALEMKNRNSNDLVALAGARLATAAETNEGVRLNEARIKTLTGCDPITARRLYHESFTFEPTHKLILSFNHKPVIADDSHGMWRRMRLTPFTRQFQPEEQDKNLLEKLKAEGPGILALAVRGCLLWQKHGLGMPPAVAAATAAYRAECDHLGQFINDRCVAEPGGTVTSAALWQCYQAWTTLYDEVPLSRQVFAERLEKRGFRPKRAGHGGTHTWEGIRLREDQVAGQCGGDGDVVTQGDAITDNLLTYGDIGKISESATPRVTTSPEPLPGTAPH